MIILLVIEYATTEGASHCSLLLGLRCCQAAAGPRIIMYIIIIGSICLLYCANGRIKKQKGRQKKFVNPRLLGNTRQVQLEMFKSYLLKMKRLVLNFLFSVCWIIWMCGPSGHIKCAAQCPFEFCCPLSRMTSLWTEDCWLVMRCLLLTRIHTDREGGYFCG